MENLFLCVKTDQGNIGNVLVCKCAMQVSIFAPIISNLSIYTSQGCTYTQITNMWRHRFCYNSDTLISYNVLF